MDEKNLKKIFKELDKLNSLAVKMDEQDQKIYDITEEIFRDEISEGIRENGIFDRYLNGEGYCYENFKKMFNVVLKDINIWERNKILIV